MTDDNAIATESISIFDAHPALGRYRAHYTSSRARLVILAGIAYVVGVGILQVIFAGVDDETASIFLPLLFAGLALPLAWLVMHMWNREVILYEEGFSYREGSNQAFFRYENIEGFRQQAQRLSLFGLIRYDRYQATLRSNQDEYMMLNYVYRQVDDLITDLEKFITRDRLPVVRQQLIQSETVPFHDNLKLSVAGIHYGQEMIPWQQFTGYDIANGELTIQTMTQGDWSVPLHEIDHLRLLLILLREQVSAQESTT